MSSWRPSLIQGLSESGRGLCGGAVGADVLAWLGDVAVAVWGWVKALDLSDIAAWVAAGIAAFALLQNRRSREIARQAKDAATEANEIAREANDLFKQQDERAGERHDVRWEGGFVQPGVYRLVNRGRDAAHDVVAEVDFDGETFRSEEELVPGGEYVEFSIPPAAKAHADAMAVITPLRTQLAALKAHDQSNSRPMGPRVAGYRLSDLQSRIESTARDALNLWMEDRVLWQTRLGNNKSHKASGRVTDLGAEL